ncbi:MAG: hypothetical protein M1812_006146 [Candelaria pacifica]|nr:MAG: hypothetical protein M1812_006146 [Candelaria pacifica]
MTSPSQSLRFPVYTRAAFEGGRTIVSYYQATQKMNGADVVIEEIVARKAYEIEVNRVFGRERDLMQKYLNQIQSPEAWLYWHPTAAPYRVTTSVVVQSDEPDPVTVDATLGTDQLIKALFSKSNAWFHVVRPQSSQHQKDGLVHMMNDLTPQQEVIVPYYGLSSLANVSYVEVARKAVVVGSTTYDRALIDHVVAGIIYNEFHFADGDAQYAAYESQIVAASTRPFPPSSPLRPKRKLDLDENYDEDDEGEDDEGEDDEGEDDEGEDEPEAKKQMVKLDEAEGYGQQGSAEDTNLIDKAKELASHLRWASQEDRLKCIGVFMETMNLQEYLMATGTHNEKRAVSKRFPEL